MTEQLSILTPTLPFTVEQAELSDLAAIHQLEKLCFPLDAWPWIELVAAMSLPRGVRFKAIWDGVLVGFAAGEKERQQHVGWLSTICVHPDYRGKGIGSVLMEMCEQNLKMPRVRLTVREFNDPAIDLYTRNGYTAVTRWPRFYAGGVAAIVMEKELSR